MTQKPPSGLIETSSDSFRRQQRSTQFILRKIFQRYFIHVLICVAVLALNAGLLYFDSLKRFEYIVLDQFFKWRPSLQTDSRIIFIDIAEDSMQAIGRWPWPRRYHAVMTHILHEWGARATVFDILFSEPSDDPDEDYALHEAIEEAGNVYLARVKERYSGDSIWIHSLPELEKAAKGIGHINIFPDSDGVVRRINPFLEAGNMKLAYLPLQVVYDEWGKPVSLEDVPVDEDGTLLVNWAGKWSEGFKHYSFLDIIRSYELIHNDKKPILNPEIFKGKICIIGVTAVGNTDIKPNPLETTYPSVGFHANVMNSFFKNSFIRAASRRQNGMAFAIIGFLAMMAFMLSRSIWAGLAGLFFGVVWVGVTYYLFSFHGIWMYTVYPLTGLFTLYIASSIYNLFYAQQQQRKLFDLAVHDGLTGLYVIRYFRELLNQATYESCITKAPLTVIILDVDFFKKVNDTYGHAAGDMVLKEMAKILQSQTRHLRKERERDCVARYGGEEFIILVKNCPLERAVFKVAERIRQAVQGHSFQYNGQKIPVTISLGVATLRRTEKVPDMMVLRADKALYRAKENGRNQTCLEEEAAA